MTKPQKRGGAAAARGPHKPEEAGSTPAPATKKTKRHDWEAIERDYRTGKFSLRELEAKHGAAASEISRRARRPGKEWTKDLAEAVKQATDAALIRELTTEAQENTTAVVLAVAEVNKQVILRHRSDIAQARSVTVALLNEIRSSTEEPEQLRALFEKVTEDMDQVGRSLLAQRFGDLMKVHSRVSSMHKLADTLAKLQVLERRAFGLDDTDSGDKPAKGGGGESKFELSDDDLLAVLKGRATA